MLARVEFSLPPKRGAYNRTALSSFEIFKLSLTRQHALTAVIPIYLYYRLVGDGHGARRAGADDPPGCHQGGVADLDREESQ